MLLALLKSAPSRIGPRLSMCNLFQLQAVLNYLMLGAG